MEIETTATAITVALIAGTLVVSGPMVTGSAGGQSVESRLDDGTAAVDDVAFSDSFVVDDGRFGTGVAYVRIPDVTVTLSSVTGHPRLVYRVRVPGLRLDRRATRLLGPGSRVVTIGMNHRAYEYWTVSRDQYRATVSVHVQSFEVYRTVRRQNVTVEVRTDD